MFLHINKEIKIYIKNIIAIVDIKIINLENIVNKNIVKVNRNVANKNPKSIILVKDNIYITNISASSLIKRLK